MNNYEYRPTGIVVVKEIEWVGFPRSKASEIEIPKNGFIDAVCLHKQKYDAAPKKEKNECHGRRDLNRPGVSEYSMTVRMMMPFLYDSFEDNGSFIEIMKNHTDGIDKNCTCGVYGWFNIPPVENSENVIILVESGGTVFAGEKNILRMQQAQVVGVVIAHKKKKQIPTAVERVCSGYFDVPLLTIAEAEALIEQQRVEWLV